MKTDDEISLDEMLAFARSRPREQPAIPAPLTFREQAAIAAMQGMLARSWEMGWHPDPIASDAVDLADALEAALKKGGAA